MSCSFSQMPLYTFIQKRWAVTNFCALNFITWYGMVFPGISWKVAMLVLSSLALVLGFVILILSILQNRWEHSAHLVILQWVIQAPTITPVAGWYFLFMYVCFPFRKKNVVVLKSYTRTGEESQPGSPLLHDRAPLTKNPMKSAAHSPALPRGEIFVAWKDGTVTPLFDKN